MQIHFILVNPARGENVGFAARALKTMGFKSLRIVGKELQHSTTARKTGYGAHDVLDRVVRFTTLSEALSDIDISVGTTSRRRIKRYDNHSPAEINQIISSKRGVAKQVGLVFGSEENGLSTAELDQCDLVSTIPLDTDYPSLNLAQSVLIYAWEISQAESLTEESVEDPELQVQLKGEIKQLLTTLGISRKPLLTQRIMDRILTLNADDSALLMSVLGKLKRRL